MSASEMRSTPGLFPDLPGSITEHSRAEGMLPAQEIRELISKGYVRTPPYQPITERQIQPASLDLRLGEVGYRVQASFVPQHSTVEQGIHDAGLKMSRVDLTRPTVFEKGCVYIVPLLEELELPDDISARANPKSSTGRLDVFTRLITDHGVYFDADIVFRDHVLRGHVHCDSAQADAHDAIDREEHPDQSRSFRLRQKPADAENDASFIFTKDIQGVEKPDQKDNDYEQQHWTEIHVRSFLRAARRFRDAPRILNYKNSGCVPESPRHPLLSATSVRLRFLVLAP